VACDEVLEEQGIGYCTVCGMRQPEPGQRVEAVDGDVAAVTDKGRRRSRNEDAFALATTPLGRVLAVVCDGVSTTTSADEASKRATEAALFALERHADERSGADALAEAFTAARHAVAEIRWLPTDGLGPPSCTFLAAVVAGNTVDLSSVGDCRGFWLPEHGEPTSLTCDDSWAAEQVLAGAMTSEAAHADTRSHRITRWLGQDADPSWAPRAVSFTATEAGRLVLCSDGLWNYAGEAADIAGAVEPGGPLSTARRLVDFANGQGGQDNITVVVVDVPGPPGRLQPSPKGRVA
jgi:serine/threonine protein phosphatase PrpC